MESADQFDTLSRRCLMNSYIGTALMTTAMGAVAMTTVRFVTQLIQMNSRLLTAMIDITKLQFCVSIDSEEITVTFSY